MAFMDFANSEVFFLTMYVDKIYFITDFDGAWHNCTYVEVLAQPW